MKISALCILFICFIISCTSSKVDIIKENQIRRIESYNGNIDLFLSDKIIDVPENILDYLMEMDSVDNYFPYKITEHEKLLFINYCNILPSSYIDLLNNKVIAIYFIKNFKGGGMTNYLFDESNNMYITLYFNPEIFEKTISEFISYRDNSFFHSNDIVVSIEISSEYKALLYILLHELSHVYDYYNHITPFTELELRNIISHSERTTEFVNGIWKNYHSPVERYNKGNYQNISFYDLGKRINDKNIIQMYDKLMETPFISIYSTQNWAEDFAEYYTYYYLKSYMNMEYKTKIYRNGILEKNYNLKENKLINKRLGIMEKIK
jgi:hypothetical protein